MVTGNTPNTNGTRIGSGYLCPRLAFASLPRRGHATPPPAVPGAEVIPRDYVVPVVSCCQTKCFVAPGEHRIHARLHRSDESRQNKLDRISSGHLMGQVFDLSERKKRRQCGPSRHQKGDGDVLRPAIGSQSFGQPIQLFTVCEVRLQRNQDIRLVHGFILPIVEAERYGPATKREHDRKGQIKRTSGFVIGHKNKHA